MTKLSSFIRKSFFFCKEEVPPGTFFLRILITNRSCCSRTTQTTSARQARAASSYFVYARYGAMPSPTRIVWVQENGSPTGKAASDASVERELREDRRSLALRQNVSSALLSRDAYAKHGRTHRKAIEYEDVESLWHALTETGGCVKLLSARWLVNFARVAAKRSLTENASLAGLTSLPQRQECPAEAFADVGMLKRMHEDSEFIQASKGLPRRAPLLAVSYIFHNAKADGHIEGGHPDPEGKTLQHLGRGIEEWLKTFKLYGFADVGVYLNWCSCFQLPRALHQVGAFKRSQTFFSLWFAHKLTTVLLCTTTPEAAPPFHARGVNAFEHACAWLLKTVDDDGKEGWPRVLEFRQLPEEDFEVIVPRTRPPPLDVAAFEDGGACDDAIFVSADDRQLIAELWRQTLEDCLGRSVVMNYSNLGWTDEDTYNLGRILPLCSCVEKMDLSGNGSSSTERDGPADDVEEAAGRGGQGAEGGQHGCGEVVRSREAEPTLGFTRLPNTLGSLTTLRTLFLLGCDSLLSLPESVGDLISLQMLFLAGCSSLTSLPESICTLPELRELDLNRCSSLPQLPSSLDRLKKLHVLLLGGCTRLKSLPERFPPVHGLYASGCRSLTALPERLSGWMPELALSPRGLALPTPYVLRIHGTPDFPMTTLALYGCTELRSLPNNLGALSSLTHINLGECTALCSLPESLSSLTELRSVDLHACRLLQSIPPFDRLCSLTELDLRDCIILRALPEGLAELGALKVLRLEGCSLIPSSVRMTSRRPDPHRIEERWLKPEDDEEEDSARRSNAE
jgi:Leucine-rich repeat (LRR) protein